MDSTSRMKWLGCLRFQRWALVLVVSVLVSSSVRLSLLAADNDLVDLSSAIVIAPDSLSEREKRAVQLLTDEIEKRTLIKLPVSSRWSSGTPSVISIGPLSAASAISGPYFAEISSERLRSPAEGFHIRSFENLDGAGRVVVLGNDERGVLFGVGRLLRELRMAHGRLMLPANFRLSSAPDERLRGQQLGFRPKTNSYDGWTIPMWHQYVRDMIVFGTNAIELIPPRSDDAADSPHFPHAKIDVMISMSQVLDDYGIDVWVWYPALDEDYSDPETVELALKEWGEVFKQLPRIDAVFVPGGDPGHTQPRYMMALLEKQAAVLKSYHPKAEMWMSPQGFDGEWMEEFLNILRSDDCEWLTGIVHGPQVRVNIPRLRATIPKRYPIRRYPDITHQIRCQFPVPEWDLAYVSTLERESINPRPVAEANIYRKIRPYADGFITYSEGCNDDVNKIVWSSLGWDPNRSVIEILREYSRYFIGERYTDDFAQILLALEKNWEGPLLSNTSVYTTLEMMQTMEKTATPHDLLNWRFQQALYRAYYDAYVRRRLLYETDLENRAMEILRQAGELGAERALVAAEATLDRAVLERAGKDWRNRVYELAALLYQSIRMQLSVEKYQALAVGRGANLDLVDAPLNNRNWLGERFNEIRELASEKERLDAIDSIVNWTNPGPGGFYDDLGDHLRQQHLLKGLGSIEDPAFTSTPILGFENRNPTWRMSWQRHAYILYDAPLQMYYTGLDPEAAYRLRVVYGGDSYKYKVKCWADTDVLHHELAKPSPPRPLSFRIPHSATRDGELILTWRQESGSGGNGRGAQVAEVWVEKVRP